MAARLEMLFTTEGGRSATVAVADPKDGLTAAEVKAVMDMIIAKNIFTAPSGNLVGVRGARLVDRQVTEIDLKATA
ncbi:MAG: DUF2922 domain-containing protein [Clostridia bacterium]|nr:DUF2922 domain-containing protein [Clostridia bacterium]